MKKTIKRVFSLLLAAGMLLSTTICWVITPVSAGCSTLYLDAEQTPEAEIEEAVGAEGETGGLPTEAFTLDKEESGPHRALVWSAWMTAEELAALGRSPSDSNVESKTQYSDRTNTMNTVTTSSPTPPDGYTLLSDNSHWGDWSDWSADPVTATSTREVETRQWLVSDGYTQYRYGSWYNGSKSHFCGASISGAWIRYTDWSTQRYDPDQSSTWGYCGDYSHYTNGQHIGYTSYNGSTFYWTRYTIGGKNYYWEESQWVDTSYYITQYRYRDYVYSYTYYKWEYGTWSAWTDTVLTDSAPDDLSYEVRTRLMYRYCLYAITAAASGYSGTYDGSSHSASVTVSGPSSYTVYYSTSGKLNPSNYSSSGSTTKPTRTNAGENTVYYYVKDGTGNYQDANGSTYIRISPKVTATPYSGAYDGAAHKPTVTVTGAATLYYSTSAQLTYANYSSSGSTTVPTRTNAGTTTVYYIAVPSADASANTCTAGQTTITVGKTAMTAAGSGYSGTYDGSGHSASVTVSGPSSYTVYYSTSTQLTSSNYSSSGSTTKPTRTNAGENTVYYYVKDGSGNYNDASGSTYIRISPKVTATPYSGGYDGTAHKPTVTAAGSATLYYSTSAQLTYANYSSSGSTTVPTRTNAGTTTVYYIAVPSANASANTCTAGQTTITVGKTAMTAAGSGYSGIYDGSSHSASVTVSGPSSYTVYYSTATQLTSSNYSSSGSTTKPTRTNAGENTVYYYVKDGTGNYNDANGSTYIRISPKVTATAYSGAYDGAAHKPTVTAAGSATLYYSTSSQLTWSNYSSSGSATVPSRTAEGTTTVYYLAVPSANATANTCTAGTTQITISHNHIYAVTTEPTETAAGVLTGTCACGDTVYIEMPVLSTADYTFETLTAATCAEPGLEKITWKNTEFGVFSFTRQIASTAHQYAGTVTSPTCTEQGYTTYTCSVCGATYLDDYYDALGHSYEQGVCVRCGAVDPDYTEPVLFGDVDGDGDVTTADAVRLVRYLVELEELTPEQALAADVNHDGDITSADSIRLVRYLVGLEDSLEPSKGGSPGVSAGSFAPNSTCTRAQNVTFLYSTQH